MTDWIPWGCVTALYGDGGMGKSLLAQMLTTACAIGKPWLGLPTTACKAFGVFCEDSTYELVRRQSAINRYFGVEFGDLENMQGLCRVADDNLFMTFDASGQGHLTEFFGLVLDQCKEFGAQLIVIDTAADTFGGNENVRSQVRQFITVALGRLAQAIDGSVLLCAHPSVYGLTSRTGAGGSTAWSNSVRSRLYLERPDDDEQPDERERVLSRKKANYAGIGDLVRMHWKDGAFHVIDAPTGIVANIKKRSAETAFLKALDSLKQQGRHVSASRSANNYAPSTMIKRPERKGFRRHDIERAMEKLFTDGLIKVEQYGRPSAPSHRIVRTDRSEVRE